MTNKLSIKGGKKTINYKFKRFNTIGNEEIKAVTKVVKSGVLSKFLGEPDPDFYGGSMVKKFEANCRKYFNVKHAITVNSLTSGLTAAVGALDIEPGDEIIVSTLTMCATATAILQWNCIPVFADIDPRTFNIDPKSIEKNISPYTKAIIATDIFGQSADMATIRSIAEKYSLKIISDTAQSPGSITSGDYSGTLADIGGFSLNYHKHIHTGEGGVLVTNHDELAERLQLIRNHGEAVVRGNKVKKISNIIGNNFRLGEIECAIGIEQLKKLSRIVQRRKEIAVKLDKNLSKLEGLEIPYISDFNTHSYYVYALKVDCNLIKIHRNKIVEALLAEGVEVGGSIPFVHQLPMYQKKIAYGSKGFPWNSDICKRDVDYSSGICPIAEDIGENRIITLGLCSYEFTDKDLDLIIQAFNKIWENLEELKSR